MFAKKRENCSKDNDNIIMNLNIIKEKLNNSKNIPKKK